MRIFSAIGVLQISAKEIEGNLSMPAREGGPAAKRHAPRPKTKVGATWSPCVRIDLRAAGPRPPVKSTARCARSAAFSAPSQAPRCSARSRRVDQLGSDPSMRAHSSGRGDPAPGVRCERAREARAFRASSQSVQCLWISPRPFARRLSSKTPEYLPPRCASATSSTRRSFP